MSEIKVAGYRLRSDLLYTKTHEWVRFVAGKGYVGITDFVQHKLTEIKAVHFPEEDHVCTFRAYIGKEVKMGEVIGEVEGLKVVFPLHAPVTGKIISVNKQLKDRLHVFKKNPYGENWIVEIEVYKEDELKQLLSPEQYGKTMQESLFIY